MHAFVYKYDIKLLYIVEIPKNNLEKFLPSIQQDMVDYYYYTKMSFSIHLIIY